MIDLDKESYFKWYVIYIVVIIGLLSGMWYMH